MMMKRVCFVALGMIQDEKILDDTCNKSCWESVTK